MSVTVFQLYWIIGLSIVALLLLFNLAVQLHRKFTIPKYIREQDSEWYLLPKDEWPRWVIKLAYRKFSKGWDGEGVIKGAKYLYRIIPTAHEAPRNSLYIDTIERKSKPKG